MTQAVPDPDFEIGAGEGGGLLPPQNFSALWASAQFGLKIKGAQDPTPGSTTARGSLIADGSPRVGVATGRALK